MSASAWVCIVVVLPWALSILKWSADRPAVSNAFVRSGLSYCTYRVEVVVSGSNTPTSPVPDEASPVSSFITEKSAVKSPAATAGTDADDAGAPLLLGDLLVHAPSPNPSSATAVLAAIVLSGELIVPPIPVRIRGKPVSLVGSFSSRSSPSGPLSALSSADRQLPAHTDLERCNVSATVARFPSSPATSSAVAAPSA